MLTSGSEIAAFDITRPIYQPKLYCKVTLTHIQKLFFFLVLPSLMFFLQIYNSFVKLAFKDFEIHSGFLLILPVVFWIVWVSPDVSL